MHPSLRRKLKIKGNVNYLYVSHLTIVVINSIINFVFFFFRAGNSSGSDWECLSREYGPDEARWASTSCGGSETLLAIIRCTDLAQVAPPGGPVAKTGIFLTLLRSGLRLRILDLLHLWVINNNSIKN